MVSPRAKRAAAHQLISELGLSERKACQVVELLRSTFHRPWQARSQRILMRACGPGCARTPRSIPGGDTAALTTMPARTAGA